MVRKNPYDLSEAIDAVIDSAKTPLDHYRFYGLSALRTA
jgi:hypothetical protein